MFQELRWIRRIIPVSYTHLQEEIKSMIFKGVVAHILYRTFDKEKFKSLDFKKYHNHIQKSNFDFNLFSQLAQQGITIDNPKVKLTSKIINDLLDSILA